ncbi:carbohydrate kinase family protein [Neobacillus notoginsengisoli]|uniref:Carbohydrate kinase family protein n=1 Tax=Neobacillus notoginsengisoli TaxID=1578198 RepID=A0A417YYQ9_9BACI|nr:carbohydrate kinase family protein [Neobacillus notoginsengisoli]RHW42775.1 carbohydrate kinase family protein [Neobacillus notoginsengisoli]
MRKGIAIAGTIAVDEIKKIASFPDKSELSPIQSVSLSHGGAVANCGISIARIDPEVPIEVVALVGEDEKGSFLQKRLKGYQNIDVSQLKIVGDTPFTDVFHDASDHTRTFFTYKGNAHLFNENTINLDELNASILHIAYILLLDGLDREDGEYGTKMARLLKAAQEKGLKTSIDIVSERGSRYQKIVPPSLKYTNYCIINEIEAGKTVGVDLRDRSGMLKTHEISGVLSKLMGLGVKDWVVIHTPEGSFGYDGAEFHSVPSLKLESSAIKGTVGAGDAYLAGTLYGAYKGLSIAESMKIGTAAAASSLLEEDSTSGVQRFEKLVSMYRSFPKNNEIDI